MNGKVEQGPKGRDVPDGNPPSPKEAAQKLLEVLETNPDLLKMPRLERSDELKTEYVRFKGNNVLYFVHRDTGSVSMMEFRDGAWKDVATPKDLPQEVKNESEKIRKNADWKPGEGTWISRLMSDGTLLYVDQKSGDMRRYDAATKQWSDVPLLSLSEELLQDLEKRGVHPIEKTKDDLVMTYASGKWISIDPIHGSVQEGKKDGWKTIAATPDLAPLIRQAQEGDWYEGKDGWSVRKIDKEVYYVNALTKETVRADAKGNVLQEWKDLSVAPSLMRTRYEMLKGGGEITEKSPKVGKTEQLPKKDEPISPELRKKVLDAEDLRLRKAYEEYEKNYAIFTGKIEAFSAAAKSASGINDPALRFALDAMNDAARTWMLRHYQTADEGQHASFDAIEKTPLDYREGTAARVHVTCEVWPHTFTVGGKKCELAFDAKAARWNIVEIKNDLNPLKPPNKEKKKNNTPAPSPEPEVNPQEKKEDKKPAEKQPPKENLADKILDTRWKPPVDPKEEDRRPPAMKAMYPEMLDFLQRQGAEVESMKDNIVTDVKTGRQFRREGKNICYRSRQADGSYLPLWGDIGDLAAVYMEFGDDKKPNVDPKKKGVLRPAQKNDDETEFIVDGDVYDRTGKFLRPLFYRPKIEFNKPEIQWDKLTKVTVSAEGKQWMKERNDVALKTLKQEKYTPGKEGGLVDMSRYLSKSAEEALERYTGQTVRINIQGKTATARLVPSTDKNGYKFAFEIDSGGQKDVWYVSEMRWMKDQFKNGNAFPNSWISLWRKAADGTVDYSTQYSQSVTSNFGNEAKPIFDTKMSRINADGLQYAINRGLENKRKEDADAAGMKDFDLPKDRPIGYIGIWHNDPKDPVVGGALRDVENFPELLASRGYNIVTGRQRVLALHYPGSTGTPKEQLRERVRELHTAGIRDFKLNFQAHGLANGMYFGDIRSTPLTGNDLQSILTEFRDSRFSINVSSCHTGGFEKTMREYRDPSGEEGRIRMFLQAKMDGVNMEGRVIDKSNPYNPETILQVQATYYEIFLNHYLQKGEKYGPAHLLADRAVKAYCGCDASAWSSSPQGGKETARDDRRKRNRLDQTGGQAAA